MANKIVEYAKGFEGKAHYIFGANDAANLNWDCSSFVQYVYSHFGYRVGRSTFEQVRVGKEVSKSDARPGDLVFFQNTYTEGVSHVGIYAGGGKFIHNSSGKKTVVESDLNSDYYQQHFHSFRRVDDSLSSAEDTAGGSGKEDKINDEVISLSFVGTAVTTIISLIAIVIGAVFFVQAFDVNIF